MTWWHFQEKKTVFALTFSKYLVSNQQFRAHVTDFYFPSFLRNSKMSLFPLKILGTVVMCTKTHPNLVVVYST